MAEAEDIRFQSPTMFAGETGIVDRENHVIRGVSVITGGVEAEGHALQVDDTTLKQLQTCAKAKGKIPVNLDHGTGVKDLNGYLTYFRMDGNKLRADWHLLRSHDESPKMLERAEVMPDCFGLSVAFKGPPKGVAIGGGKMAARCEKLLSVDCVTRPAANIGLFSVGKVDTGKNGMAQDIIPPTTPEGHQQPEPTLADLMKAITDLQGRFTEQEQFNQQVIEHLGGNPEEGQGDEPTLEEIASLNDEELAQLGITRADVDAAMAEYEADRGETGEGQGEGQGQGQGEQGNGAAAPVAAGAVGAELSALRKEVIALQKKNQIVELRAKQNAEEVELSAIEEKALTLASQRDTAIQLAEKLTAENEALRLAVRTGTRPVKAGVDNGLRLFGANDGGELHQFQVRVKQIQETGKAEGEAIRLAQKENPAIHADWLQSIRKNGAGAAA